MHLYMQYKHSTVGFCSGTHWPTPSPTPFFITANVCWPQTKSNMLKFRKHCVSPLFLRFWNVLTENVTLENKNISINRIDYKRALSFHMDTALTRITATTLKSTLLNFKNDLVPRAMSEVIPECNAKSKPWAKPGMAQSQQWINKFKNNGMFGKHFLSSSLLPVPLSWAKGTWYSIQMWSPGPFPPLFPSGKPSGRCDTCGLNTSLLNRQWALEIPLASPIKLAAWLQEHR